MRVHLVRHADALGRRKWEEPDRVRPLSKTGHRQAEVLANLIDDPAAHIRSSPAVRCVTTVGPLAERLGIELVLDERLAEGSDPQIMTSWLCDETHPFEHLVLCAHGDLLPEVLRLLQLRGMTLDGPNAVAKGSVWSFDIVGGSPTHASYRPPPR